MSKLNTAQKRTMGKRSPLSKRPKLDFSSGLDSPLNKTRSSNGYYANSKENTDSKKPSNPATTSDWDDDFSGDMLEKVCMIADLSQAMVNNDPVSLEEEDHKSYSKPDQNANINDELEKLRLENEKLKESFKTKEGEVQILRSKLKRTEEAKQAETTHNKKVLDEMQQKYKDEINAAKKENEAMKTNLHFKDLELKSLTDRYKQLDSSTSKIKLVEPEAMHVDCRKSLFNLSQVTSKQKTSDSDHAGEVKVNNIVNFKFPSNVHHEGQKLSGLLCPEFFTFIEEPDIIPLYTFNNATNCHLSRLDFDIREKYKWSGLPKQMVFIKDMYNKVSSLFLVNNFDNQFDDILNTCVEILTFQKNTLIFLEKVQQCNSEHDDSDQSLLENEDPVFILTIKHLLNGKKIKKEECGIEARRALALLLSLMKSSNSILNIISHNVDFLQLIKALTTSIGNLRRPLRYTGLLVATTLLLQEILQVENLNDEILTLIREILEEVIFARPKLDVLREVIITLQGGRNYVQFTTNLCRKGLVNSCALYMDSKLQQAMFFTKDSCPLQLLFIQIMGLSCLPTSRRLCWEVTESTVKCLNLLMDTQHHQKIKWLPCNPFEEDRCFDIMDCLVYLLNLCIKDYKNGNEFLITIIKNGASLVKRILKTDQRLLHDNMHSLRFAVELKTLQQQDLLKHSEAVSWIIDLLESDLKNQDNSRENSCKLTDADRLNALRINDEFKIY